MVWTVMMMNRFDFGLFMYIFSNLSPPPQKRLAWALFVLLLSTLVCCQPTELILGFLVS